jgi:hypothetical protein
LGVWAFPAVLLVALAVYTALRGTGHVLSVALGLAAICAGGLSFDRNPARIRTYAIGAMIFCACGVLFGVWIAVELGWIWGSIALAVGIVCGIFPRRARRADSDSQSAGT